MNIAIVGGRDFSNYPILKMSMWSVIAALHLNPKAISFHSGTAKGADKLGERFAHELSAPLFFYPPDWNKFGKSAGIKRNIEMSDAVDTIVAFWSGSTGTKHMIEYSIRKNKTVFVFNYEGKLVIRHDRN